MSDVTEGNQDPAWLPGGRRPPTRPRSALPGRSSARPPAPRPDSRHSAGSSRRKRGRGRKPGRARQAAADLERELAALRGSHDRLQAELDAKEAELESLRSSSCATKGPQKHTSDSVGTPAPPPPPPALGALPPPSEEADQLIMTPQSFMGERHLDLLQVRPSEVQPLLGGSGGGEAAGDDAGMPMAFSPFAAVTSPRDTLFSPAAASDGQHRTAFSDWRPRDSVGFGDWGAPEAGEGPEGRDLVQLLTAQPGRERSGSLMPE